MIVDFARIPPEGASFEGEDEAAILDLGEEAESRPEGPVKYRLKVQAVSNELIVNGELSADMSFRCSKCGDFFGARVQEPGFKCVREIEDEGECVDLTGDIREAMILAFPSYPQCNKECRGLCPQCGTNLNKGQCGCEPPKDVRWTELDSLELS